MKKALSMLLVFVMVFTMLPVYAAAAESETTVYFDTDFEDSMTVGDTFTFSAYLANNPGMATMTVSLKWNEDVVKFNGFAMEYNEETEEEELVTDVFKSVWTPVFNPWLGIITASRTRNTKKEGLLFVANFEIIGTGDLELGLKDTDRTEFEMCDQDITVIDVAFD